MMERPAYCQDKHLEFLDNLRESGITNMLGARPYIVKAYPKLDINKAGEILAYWMETFGSETR